MKQVEGLLVHGHPGKYGLYEDDLGLGIYAQKDYRKGELLALAHGPRITDRDKRLSSHAIQVGKRLFIEPPTTCALRYLNHSCTPNAYVDMEKLIARKDIKRGEEVTADYSLFTDFPSWSMECRCGAKGCRKLILPYTKVKPKKFISSYLA